MVEDAAENFSQKGISLERAERFHHVHVTIVLTPVVLMKNSTIN